MESSWFTAIIDIRSSHKAVVFLFLLKQGALPHVHTRQMKKETKEKKRSPKNKVHISSFCALSLDYWMKLVLHLQSQLPSSKVLTSLNLCCNCLNVSVTIWSTSRYFQGRRDVVPGMLQCNQEVSAYNNKQVLLLFWEGQCCWQPGFSRLNTTHR